MSGVEAIGVLASTAQLAAYVGKVAAFLSDIYERLKHAPERIEQYAHQLKRLIDTILHIKDNCLLHTKVVFAQLECTIIQACSLRDLLVKTLGQYTQPSRLSRYWKLLKGKKERYIFLALQNLEREKTQLTLCLTAAQIEVLQDIQREVRGADSDMSNRSSPRRGQAIAQNPSLPAPTNFRYTETPDNEVSDKVMEDVGSKTAANDKEKAPGSLKLVIKSIVSEKKGKQENIFGKAAAAGVTTDMKVTDITAKDEGSQINSF